MGSVTTVKLRCNFVQTGHTGYLMTPTLLNIKGLDLYFCNTGNETREPSDLDPLRSTLRHFRESVGTPFRVHLFLVERVWFTGRYTVKLSVIR